MSNFVGFFCCVFVQWSLFFSLCLTQSLTWQGIIPWAVGEWIAFWIILTWILHLILVFSDPGKVCLPHSQQKNHPRYCVTCRCLKTPSVHHCSKCQICVEEMDHHCPVVSNCIGVCNRKKFILLLASGFILLFSASTLSAYLFAHLNQPILFSRFRIPCSLLLWFSLKMGFTCAVILYLILEQIMLISHHMTKLEGLRAGLRLTHLGTHIWQSKALREFFGCYPWDWFWPF